MRLAIITLAATAAAVSTAVIATGALAAKVSPLGPAPPPGTGLPSGQCIRTHDIRNHSVVDNKTMLIDYNGRATYRLTMKGSCLAGAGSTDPIVTRNPPGRHLACMPIDFDITVSKNGFPSPCIVESVVKLTPEELAAVPGRLKP